MAVHHDKREAVALFSREVMGVILNMTGGRCAAGEAGRPKVSPVISLYSFLLNKTETSAQVEVDGVELSYPSVAGVPFRSEQIKRVSDPLGATDEGAMEEVPLLKLAVARSGDKGRFANIGVIARQPEYMAYISQSLTAESVGEWFSHVAKGRVERFYLPGIEAFNFFLHDALGGGGVSSMNVDVQGKTYAQQILAMPVSVPVGLIKDN
jgi:hypothetical protein